MQQYKPFFQLIAAEGVALGILVSAHLFHFSVPCPFKVLTGIPCPGCGGTRVLFAIAEGKFIEALYINPLSVLVILFAVIAPIWLFIDCYRETNTLSHILKGKWSPITVSIVTIIILCNWLWNIYKQL